MPMLSRRQFLAQVSAGATVFGLSHLLDEAKRLELYHEAQKIAQDEVPGVMLGGRRNMVAHAANVKNARSHSQNWSSRFEYIWIDA